MNIGFSTYRQGLISYENVAHNMSTHKPIGFVVMAAGLGKRMNSTKLKVLNEVAGHPMITHILFRILSVSEKAEVCLVVNERFEEIRQILAKYKDFSKLKIEYVIQKQACGTGDAARVAIESVWGKKMVEKKASILILPGDLPLISNELVRQMVEPMTKNAAMRLLTCELSDPRSYGRIVRRKKEGPVIRIVEEKDANIREKEIKEVGASIYFFNSAFLKAGLKQLNNKNAQNEFYLTDLVSFAARTKKKIEVLKWMDGDELRGVNNPWELSLASRILNHRLVQSWALKGVYFKDPCTTWIDAEVEIASEVHIDQAVSLLGNTKIAKGCKIGSHVTLKNVIVDSGAEIKSGTYAEDSTIGKGSKCGPYAHLRPGSVVGENSKIGNYVELKNAQIGNYTNISHLSYVGDAKVGSNVNIGCGFVTCNFDGQLRDGKRKHQTTIEDGVFIGSDCQAVAPIKIGADSYIASGSTITQEVPSGDLAIARSRQINKTGYAKKLKGLS